MNRRLLIVVLAAAAFCGQAFGTIRYVSQTGASAYTTINAASSASATGDTIMVAPGTYTEGLSVPGRRYIMGAGMDLSIMTSGLFLSNGVNGTVIEGMRIDAASGVAISASGLSDTIIVRRCFIRSTNNQVLGLGGAGRFTAEDCVIQYAPVSPNGTDVVGVPTSSTKGVVFRNCVFTHNNPIANVSTAMSGVNAGVIEVYNCVFLNFNKLFNLTGGQPLIAINNVAYDWVLASPTWGTLPASSTVDYIAADATAPAFPGSYTNTIALGANNPFTNYNTTSNYVYGTTDLHLAGAGGVLLTNTGNPLIFDVDASRSDLGIYGGPKPLVDNGAPPFPFTLTLTIPTLIGVGDSVNTSSTGRIGPRY